MSISAISGSSTLDPTTQAAARPTPPPPPDGQFAQLAAGAMQGTAPGPDPSTRSTPPAPPAMTNTASLLGISTSTLSSDLQSGDSLSSLASSAGVSSGGLLSAVEQDMSANAPSGAPALSGDQLAQMATGFIDGVRPGGR
jgi:hypothetical protein